MTDTMQARIDALRAEQRAQREQLLRAIGDLGHAKGLEAGAAVLRALADHKRRVVGTSELKAAADVLQEKAAEIRRAADAAIAEHKGSI